MHEKKLRLAMNLKAYGVLHPSKLPLNDNVLSRMSSQMKSSLEFKKAVRCTTSRQYCRRYIATVGIVHNRE
jgi:hypothetical protein